MITPGQIKLIRYTANKCGLNEDEYRELIMSYGVMHTKQLDEDAAKQIIKMFKEKFGFEYKRKKEKIKQEVSGKREWPFATQKQVNYIIMLWIKHSNLKSKESLNKFCKRITGIDRIEWIKHFEVQKLIRAIESLSKKGQK
ncbi:MAG: DUF1018 domain-containing protein [Bacteroidota bacterium]|nr:DUF1018 domain-containing protein [Bacteroidota bacterium]